MPLVLVEGFSYMITPPVTETAPAQITTPPSMLVKAEGKGIYTNKISLLWPPGTLSAPAWGGSGGVSNAPCTVDITAAVAIGTKVDGNMPVTMSDVPAPAQAQGLGPPVGTAPPPVVPLPVVVNLVAAGQVSVQAQ